MKGNEHVKTNKGNHIMKNRNIHLPGMPVILTAVILLVFVTLVSPSQAERARTYDGTLTGGTFYCNGEPIEPGNRSTNVGSAYAQRLRRR